MLPPDQLRLVICLVLSTPLSYMMSCLQSSTKILILTCFSSLIMQVVVFQQQTPILWVQQNLVYLICKYGPRKRAGRYVLLQTFMALIIIQLRRMYLSYGVQNVDITAIFMMQVFMYVSFAYNYQDGLESQDSPRTTKRTIYKFPKYTEYMGYVLFLPSCLVGPVFQFNDFKDYLYREGIYKEVKAGFSVPGMLKQGKIFIFTTALYFILLPIKISYMLTPEFAQQNFIYKFVYLLISIMAVRFKYYSAWSLGMVAMNATGLTYNPEEINGQKINKWDRIIVSDIWTFQMDPSMKRKADGWNIPIQLALKRYIYDREYVPSQTHSNKEKKRLQIMAQQKTLAVSALWHGLYPGYFISFFHWALILQVSQQLFRIERQSPKLVYWRKKLHYVELIFINYILGYFGCCFQFMSWQKILIFFKATHFIPVITVYILNLFIVRLAVFSHRKGHKKDKSSKPHETSPMDQPKLKVWPSSQEQSPQHKKQ